MSRDTDAKTKLRTSNHRPTKRAAVRCAEEMLFEKAAADAWARAVGA
jgi:hypothetical protein